jgi:hypothetical protein
MPQIYDMGPTALLPLQRKACWGFFLPWKIRRLRPGSNPQTCTLHPYFSCSEFLWFGLEDIKDGNSTSTEDRAHSILVIQETSYWLSLQWQTLPFNACNETNLMHYVSSQCIRLVTTHLIHSVTRPPQLYSTTSQYPPHPHQQGLYRSITPCNTLT